MVFAGMGTIAIVFPKKAALAYGGGSEPERFQKYVGQNI